MLQFQLIAHPNTQGSGPVRNILEIQMEQDQPDFPTEPTLLALLTLAFHVFLGSFSGFMELELRIQIHIYLVRCHVTWFMDSLVFRIYFR